ncbi:MAG: histidinol-phosphatase [Rhodobacteraceae bacterium]|nr:histidinol-phosphatase [Paracoccaceae bacterium]
MRTDSHPCASAQGVGQSKPHGLPSRKGGSAPPDSVARLTGALPRAILVPVTRPASPKVPTLPTWRGQPLPSDLSKDVLRDVAHAMADAARAAILPYFRAPDLKIDTKDAAGFDPVTQADRAAEAAMRAVLAARRPEDGVLGEERAALATRSGLTWVLDPIDGTRGFIAGTPTWGVLIALDAGAGPVYGIIDQPYIAERFEGGFGCAEMTGPRGTIPLRTRATTRLAEAVLLTTFPEVGSPAERAGFGAVRDQVRLTRYGMDCYAYALLAAGHVDLVIEAGLQPYDVAAPIAVVEAAGGITSDWQGGPAHAGGCIVAAATPALHAEARGLLSKSIA